MSIVGSHLLLMETVSYMMFGGAIGKWVIVLRQTCQHDQTQQVNDTNI